MGKQDVVEALIDSQGVLYSEQAGIELGRDEPAQWFLWLSAALLMSARIDAAQAVRAAAALRADGLATAGAVLASDRAARVRVLNANGYARYDNQGADYLHDAARLVADRYGGDLRRLVADACDRADVLQRLRQVRGIGATGAQIFCREAQLVWDVLFPFAEGPCLDAARALGLPADAEALVRLAPSRRGFTRLVAALTRAALEGPSDAVRRAAG
ncbi:hypothetical protein GE300_12310 [Rhodobacteraceae bacterium 2CG4]|uniref:Endonuclease III n=1 Tax=Halovulum marinum TaxID=2662447 RepID=A0A6L5Z2T8_9RHOB|nr:hypothetical protein [Halovulum marinum]MSU90390.1 hypothetical protein [Halovulum marinum]